MMVLEVGGNSWFSGFGAMENERSTRVALVDCGTNTFTLHIADVSPGQWTPVFLQRRFVQLGADSFRTGRLSPSRMRRGADVLKAFWDTACNCDVSHIRAIGCSALRDARNGSDFVDMGKAIGWPIEVIDGLQEATYIHQGVAATVQAEHWSGLPALTMDIGGGSVEFILWDRSSVLGRFSLDLGVSRLTDWVKPSDPLSKADLLSVERVADQAMAPLLALCKASPPGLLVGTSGAFDALALMEDAASQWRPKNEADVLPMLTLRSRCAMLMGLSKNELAQTEGIHPDRIPYMSMACALIEHVLTRFPTIQLALRSKHTVAEGALEQTAMELGALGLQEPWESMNPLGRMQED
jgi:exopolyphosphatase/guanosine-5'-triphosphate,3'-diphosphate pyrophosphatase